MIYRVKIDVTVDVEATEESATADALMAIYVEECPAMAVVYQVVSSEPIAVDEEERAMGCEG